MTKDEKIFDIAVAKIRRSSMESAEWKHTRTGKLHSAFQDKFPTQSEELVLVSGFVSPGNWYVFTTRRVVCCFDSLIQQANPESLIESVFENFKGYGPTSTLLAEVPIEIATLSFADGKKLCFRFETGSASMAPIHAAMYWERKHRFLDKLMTSTELEQFKLQ